MNVVVIKERDGYVIRKGLLSHTYLDIGYKNGYWWPSSYKHWATNFKSIEEAIATFEKYKSDGKIVHRF